MLYQQLKIGEGNTSRTKHHQCAHIDYWKFGMVFAHINFSITRRKQSNLFLGYKMIIFRIASGSVKTGSNLYIVFSYKGFDLNEFAFLMEVNYKCWDANLIKFFGYQRSGRIF